MSFDVYLCDPETGDPAELAEPHQLAGGTYALGGTTVAWLNVTYNYSPFFYRVLDAANGLRSLSGKTAAATHAQIVAAAEKLGDDVSGDYWAATEGNAKRALLQLVELGKLRPDGIWRVS